MPGATYDYNPFIYRVVSKKSKTPVGGDFLRRERAIEHAKNMNQWRDTKEYYVVGGRANTKNKVVWKP